MLGLTYYRFSNLTMPLSKFKDLSFELKQKFFDSVGDSAKLIEIIAYCLMPNHFHFLLKQLRDDGISRFISQFTNSYTRYFNISNERVGPLFQGVFKSVHVETDEQLIHLSRYIHLNPVVSNVILESDIFYYQWSSLPDYLKGGSSLVHADPVLTHFKSPESYKQFVLDYVSYTRELEKIKHLMLDG